MRTRPYRAFKRSSQGSDAHDSSLVVQAEDQLDPVAPLLIDDLGDARKDMSETCGLLGQARHGARENVLSSKGIDTARHGPPGQANATGAGQTGISGAADQNETRLLKIDENREDLRKNREVLRCP